MKFFFKFTLMSLLFAVMLVNCSERHSKNWQRLDEADFLIEDNPDSSLIILENINPNDLKGKEERARHALLLSMAMDKNYIDTATFDVLQPAIDYYLQHGNADEQLRTYYYQSVIYLNQGKKDSAMKTLIRALNIKQPIKDSLVLARIYNSQGYLYREIYQFADAIENNIKSATIYEKAGKEFDRFACLQTALNYSCSSHKEVTADSLFGVCCQIAKGKPVFEKRMEPSIIAYMYEFKSDSEIKDTLEAYMLKSDKHNETLECMARAFAKIKNPKLAKLYLDSVNPHLRNRNPIGYNYIKYEVLKSTGDYRGACEALEIAAEAEGQKQNSILYSEQLFVQEKENILHETTHHLERKNRVILICIGVGLTFSLITMVFRYKYRLAKAHKLLEEQKNKTLESENKNLELCKTIQDEQIRRLSLTVEKLMNEHEKLEALLKEKLELSEDVSKEVKFRLEILNALLAKEITNKSSYAKPYDEWIKNITKKREAFLKTTRDALRFMHPELMEFLDSKELTEREMDFACLSALGLTGKEIGEYIHTSRHYHISSSLRKKFDMTEADTNLNLFIRGKMKE